MSVHLHDDDVVARLRADAPGYPAAGPDAGHTLAVVRRSLHRRRRWQIMAGLATVVALAVGLTTVGPIELPGVGRSVTPGGSGIDAVPNQGDPPVYPPDRMLHDAAALQLHVLPVAQELGLTTYINETPPWGRPGCRVLNWSHGSFRDRNAECSNPDDPEPAFDAESAAAFTLVSDAIGRAGVDVYRIDEGGWGPGLSFHLRDSSWMYNWYYSYVPGTPAGAQAEVRTETRLGVRRQIHVTGDWWFTVEPDD